MDDRYLAGLAAAAYSSATWQFGDVRALETGVVIAFRGTMPDDLLNWIRDFDVAPDYCGPLGWLHMGFAEGAKAIWPLVQPHVSNNTILTGHSLGGALAIITAGLMTEAGCPPADVVTFGAPRTCGDRLVDLLAPVNVRQYRHAADIVPEVPPGYQHVRPLIEIGADDGSRAVPAADYIAALVDGIRDHSKAEYVADAPGDGM